VEIDIPALEKIIEWYKREVRPLVDEYVRRASQKLYLLGGAAVNLATAEGHPAEVMGYELRELQRSRRNTC